MGLSEKEIANVVLRELQRITVSMYGVDITQYIDKDRPVLVQWSRFRMSVCVFVSSLIYPRSTL